MLTNDLTARAAGTSGRGAIELVPSVCPHDCTSTCALDVERLDARSIGRVRGSTRNTYTAGVICEKVGRYAERVHHPDRLLHPLRRVGPKGSGQFARISWEEALDRVAEAFTEQAARHGLETVWPYFYAGTMGLVQRDGITLVHRGLAREDLFLCVHEQFLTETAAYADVVLPATMFLEHDDFYTASGHTYFQVARKVVEPPGECRENHFVISELARRLGAEHPGFGMTAWEIMDRTLQRSDMWDARTNVERGGQDMALPFEEAHFLRGFKWPDGRFRFKPDWDSFGGRGWKMPRLPDHFDVIDQATAEKPFRLVAAPARTFLNSTFTETPGSLTRERRPTAVMNPDDCVALGVAAGDRVTLGNERGVVVAYARPREGQQRGVVVVEGIWPNKHFEGGIGINALTSAEPGYPNGGAAFHDTAVWVRRS